MDEFQTTDAKYSRFSIDHDLPIESLDFDDGNTDIKFYSYADAPTAIKECLRDDKKIRSSRTALEYYLGYGSLAFTTADSPFILYETGAYPCSLIITFDDQGNCAYLHLTRYTIITEGKTLEKFDEAEQFQQFQKFMQKQMQEQGRLILTATNLDKNSRLMIIDSIKSSISFLFRQRIKTIFTADNSPFFNPKIHGYSVPKETINCFFFIPAALTNDNRNKLFLVGSTPDSPVISAAELINMMMTDYPSR